jgi:hypothetical protein
MKQSSFTLLCCLFLASFTSFAQNTTTNEDDIYFNSADAAQAKLKQKKNKNSSVNQNASNSVYYSNSSYNDQNNSYQYQNYDDEAYVDYDDNDDYYYASNLRRFNNPFYSQSYYSFYVNPYWYNPYWVDPYWSYNRFYQNQFNYNYGPYWSSNWSWNTWFGYNGFSCYNYPYYSGYWGGNMYNNGFWDGYYYGMNQFHYYNSFFSGNFGNNNNYRYGPHGSMNGHFRLRNDFARNNYSLSGINNGPRSGFKMSDPNRVNRAMENRSNQATIDNTRNGYNNLNDPGNRDFRNNRGNYQAPDRSQPIAAPNTTPNQNPPSRFDRYNNNEQPYRSNPIRQVQPSPRYNEQRNQDNFRPAVPASEPRRIDRPIEQRPREMGSPGGGFRPR